MPIAAISQFPFRVPQYVVARTYPTTRRVMRSPMAAVPVTLGEIAPSSWYQLPTSDPRRQAYNQWAAMPPAMRPMSPEALLKAPAPTGVTTAAPIPERVVEVPSAMTPNVAALIRDMQPYFDTASRREIFNMMPDNVKAACVMAALEFMEPTIEAGRNPYIVRGLWPEAFKEAFDAWNYGQNIGVYHFIAELVAPSDVVTSYKRTGALQFPYSSYVGKAVTNSKSACGALAGLRAATVRQQAAPLLAVIDSIPWPHQFMKDYWIWPNAPQSPFFEGIPIWNLDELNKAGYMSVERHVMEGHVAAWLIQNSKNLEAHFATRVQAHLRAIEKREREKAERYGIFGKILGVVTKLLGVSVPVIGAIVGQGFEFLYGRYAGRKIEASQEKQLRELEAFLNITPGQIASFQEWLKSKATGLVKPPPEAPPVPPVQAPPAVAAPILPMPSKPAVETGVSPLQIQSIETKIREAAALEASDPAKAKALIDAAYSELTALGLPAPAAERAVLEVLQEARGLEPAKKTPWWVYALPLVLVI